MQMIHRPSLSRVVRRAVFMVLKGVLPLLPLLLAVSCKRQPDSVIPSGSEKLIIPRQGAYTGAYIDFGDNEDDVTVEAIDDFEKLTGKHQAIIASSSYWGEQTFPTDSVYLIQQHGSIPLIYWSPWDLPYEEGNGPDRFSLENILAGKWDAYIDAWAASAKEFGHPLFVSFAKEPNGSGYPWSGMYCGGDKIVPGTSSNQGANTPTPTPTPHAESPTPQNLTFDEVTSGPPDEFEGPQTYKKAYRYVVDRVRAKGASNIIWVFQVMNFSTPQDDWNYAAQYYPGAAYVDWIGLSVCGQQYPEDQWSAFTPLFKQPYAEVCRLDPAKPIMLAEWRCGEFPKSGSKSAFITEAFETMKADYPRLKAAVFWHEQWQNDDNSTSDLRVNSSPESLDAYRKGVADPFWLDRPVYSK